MTNQRWMSCRHSKASTDKTNALLCIYQTMIAFKSAKRWLFVAIKVKTQISVVIKIDAAIGAEMMKKLLLRIVRIILLIDAAVPSLGCLERISGMIAYGRRALF